MNFYEERIRKQVEKSKQEAAEKAAKEYERSLTVQYQTLLNSTIETFTVTEAPHVTVTEPVTIKERNTPVPIGTTQDKTYIVTEGTTSLVVLSTLSPSKEVLEKRVKEAVERARKEKVDSDYRSEQEFLYQNYTRPILHPDLSPKFLSALSPPLATMPDKLYNGLSVQQTEGGLLVTANLSTFSGIAGLLGVMGVGNFLLYYPF
jgi:hypothetical protein